MNKKDHFSLPLVGLGSLLVIFVALCLVVLAQLALSSTKADEKLSDQSHNTIMSQYQAEREADAIIAQLRNGIVPEGVAFEDGIYSFQCVISDTQSLEVEIQLDGETHTILRWQIVFTDQQPTDADPSASKGAD